MPWIALVAAAAAKAIGSMQEANAHAAQLNSEGAQHDRNAEIAEQNAVISWEQGTAQEGAVRRRAAGILGVEAAVAGESGFAVGSGSALDVAKQSATNAELDSLTTMYNADLRARGFKMQAEQERYAGNLAHAGAGAARDQGIWGALTGITSSAASYYGSSMSVQPTTQASFGMGGGSGPEYASGGMDFGGSSGGFDG